MAKVVEQVELAPMQYADLLENGEVWVHDNEAAQDIKLDALAATKLYDFMLLHMTRLQEVAQGQKVADYNRQMDERNRIIAESREKPWLPQYDGSD